MKTFFYKKFKAKKAKVMEVFSMAQSEFKWMPHHEGAIPPSGQGERISTYNVALEGWRRGLKLEFYSVFEEETKQKLRYSLSNADRKHHFQLSMGDKVTHGAFDIFRDENELDYKPYEIKGD